MHFIPFTTHLKKLPRGGSAAIGNFDGVHLGHQALLQQLQRLPGPRGVILFEPHPKERFAVEGQAPRRILMLADKLYFLREQGLDYALVIHFNTQFSRWTPQQFIEVLLLKKLGLSTVVVGPDFRFGYQRQGAIADLEAAGLKVQEVSWVQSQGKKISSTLIRESLLAGEFQKVQSLLGHAYTVTGRVLQGAQKGRTLGFPTLNLALRPNMLLSGVYAVKIHGLADNALHGVANVGRRPSLNPLVHPLLEVHVFDFQKDVYGQRVRVEFVTKLREERRFPSLAELVAQISQDVQNAKKELQ